MTQGRSQPLTALKLRTANFPRVSDSSTCALSSPATKTGTPARWRRTSSATGDCLVARLRTLGARIKTLSAPNSAMEVILAAKAEGNDRLVAEVADLFYHLSVLLAARGLAPADVEAELRRRRVSGGGAA